jgi:hypothetical protein
MSHPCIWRSQCFVPAGIQATSPFRSGARNKEINPASSSMPSDCRGRGFESRRSCRPETRGDTWRTVYSNIVMRHDKALNLVAMKNRIHVRALQTPRKSSVREILNARAIFSILMSDRFRSPRSIPPIYVRSNPHMSANSSCDTPILRRLPRTTLPNRSRTSTGVTMVFASYGVDMSTDYKYHRKSPPLVLLWRSSRR